ncbi:MAG TPA: hypothetical protein VN455_11405 [Methanotrichaceae archaeon]|nr:hypothetical protein [Methanotrichaceae archaeon]
MPEERRASSRSGSKGSTEKDLEKESKGTMTVEEAGHMGGEIGGQKVKRLIEEGKEYERETGKSSETKSQRR